VDDGQARDAPPLEPSRILDAVADPVLVISRSFRIVYMNAAARARYGSPGFDDEATSCHAVMHGSAKPCFEAGVLCPVCEVFETGARAHIVHDHVSPDGTFAAEEVVASPLFDADGRVAYVVEDVRGAAGLLASKEVAEHMRAELDLLRGILPTCAGCKRIRTADGRWQEIEAYVAEHSGAEFSHGLCPACVDRLYPDYREKKG
jgi:hypothetical protein